MFLLQLNLVHTTNWCKQRFSLKAYSIGNPKLLQMHNPKQCQSLKPELMIDAHKPLLKVQQEKQKSCIKALHTHLDSWFKCLNFFNVVQPLQIIRTLSCSVCPNIGRFVLLESGHISIYLHHYFVPVYYHVPIKINQAVTLLGVIKFIQYKYQN
jgi:hypothetical protein